MPPQDADGNGIASTRPRVLLDATPSPMSLRAEPGSRDADVDRPRRLRHRVVAASLGGMWLPEFQAVLDRAGARLDESRLELSIDDPQSGRIVGEASFDAYRDWSADWLRVRDGRPREIATTVGPSRVVGEFDVDLRQDG